MAFEIFKPRTFKPHNLALIETANDIVAPYEARGIILTLRALHYQFVARDLYHNTVQNYKRLGSILNDARLAGLFDWDTMEDRIRNLADYDRQESPQGALDNLVARYLEDVWETQPVYMEYWVEKDAVLGTIQPVCHKWRLPYFVCRGNVSQSEMYIAGQRLSGKLAQGFRVVIVYMGDHDPNGIDMSRDVTDRLNMFTYDSGIEVRRIALNMDQVREYNPPSNFAKEGDSRFKKYVERFGVDKSWELDALDPFLMEQLIEDAVLDEIDRDAWDSRMSIEADNRAALEAFADRLREEGR